MRIIVDSREQHPYTFGEVETIRRALPAGDYSLEGLEESFAIERKSMADLVHTVLCAKRRFRAELNKLRTYRFAAIVVEGSVADILAGNYRSDIAPQALLGIVAGITMTYQPIQVHFAGDRPHACALVGEMLKLGEKYFIEPKGEDGEAK